MRPGAFPKFLWLLCQVGGLRSLGGRLGTGRQCQCGENKVQSLDESPFRNYKMGGKAYYVSCIHRCTHQSELGIKDSRSASQGDAERIVVYGCRVVKRRIFSEGRIRFMVRSVRHVLPRSWERYMRTKEVKDWVNGLASACSKLPWRL